MGMPVFTVASGGLAVVESTVGCIPVTESAFGIPVTKVVGGNGLLVVYVNANNGPVTPPVTYTTLDGAVSPDITLSNGKLTATHNVASAANCAARSTKQLATGLYYFESTMTTVAAQNACAGIIGAAITDDQFIAGVGVLACYRSTGNIYSNGGNSGKTLGAITNGTVLGFAVNLTTRKAWIRKGSGNWNGDATGDPVAGVAGVTLHTAVAQPTFAPACGFGSTVASLNDSITMNFGASAFVGAVPSGYTAGWPA